MSGAGAAAGAAGGAATLASPWASAALGIGQALGGALGGGPSTAISGGPSNPYSAPNFNINPVGINLGTNSGYASPAKNAADTPQTFSAALGPLSTSLSISPLIIGAGLLAVVLLGRKK